jgi:hypothetical protein
LDDSIDAVPGGLVQELSFVPVTKDQGRICFLILAAAFAPNSPRASRHGR